MSPMDTITDVLARLDEAGWTGQFEVRDGGIGCVHCDQVVPADQHTVDETYRFEGESDPSDEAIVFALTSPCGHRGTLVTAFGPDTPAAVGETVRALRTMHRDPPGGQTR